MPHIETSLSSRRARQAVPNGTKKIGRESTRGGRGETAYLTSLGGRDPDGVAECDMRKRGRSAHEPAEILEQVAAIVRAGGRLWVVLDAEDRHARVPHPFQRAVVEVDVRQFDVLRQAVDVHAEAVILGGYLDLARTVI